MANPEKQALLNNEDVPNYAEGAADTANDNPQAEGIFKDNQTHISHF